MISPKDHPNASMVVITGYLASALVYAAKKAGVSLTLEEATSFSTLLIAVALIAVGKTQKKPAARRSPRKRAAGKAAKKS